MSMNKQLFTPGIVAIATLGASLLSIQPLTTANAVQSGDVVVFLIEPTFPIEIISDPKSKIIFTGASSSTADTTGCGSGEFPLQQVVVRQEQGHLIVRTDIIVTSQIAPIEAGTQLEFYSLDTTCMIGDTLYYRYNGVVR
jgi:hypothetical protein